MRRVGGIFSFSVREKAGMRGLLAILATAFPVISVLLVLSRPFPLFQQGQGRWGTGNQAWPLGPIQSNPDSTFTACWRNRAVNRMPCCCKKE